MLTTASGKSRDVLGSAIVKILDFGLARLGVQTEDRELTSPGQLMGTLDYMAPEQATDSREVDIRADIYSLGATLYKLLTGHAPFTGEEHNTLGKKIVAVVTKEPRPIHELRPDLPADLAAIVSHMLAKNPENRLATPREVVSALQSFASGCQLEDLLTPDSTDRDDPLPADPSRSSTSSYQRPAPPKPQPSENRDRGRRIQLTLSLTVAFSLFILAGVTLIIRDRDGRVVEEVDLPPGTTLEIADEPNADAPKAGSTDVAQVAQRILSVGGLLIVSQGDDRPTEIRELGQLPEGEFRISRIDLSGDVEFQDRDLELLGLLPGLDNLSFTGNPNFSDSTLDAIHTLPVRKLFINNVYLTDAGLQHLNLSDLEQICVNRTSIGDEALKYLGSAPPLVKLAASDTSVTDEGLKHLSDHPLVLVDLHGCSGVTDKALVHLKNVHGELDLTGTSVTKEGTFQLQRTNPNVAISTDWTTEPNRLAAHWVVACGGTVIAQHDFGSGYPYSRTLRETSDIPGVDFRITGIALNVPELDHRALHNLDGLDHLRRLDLSGTQFDPIYLDRILESIIALSANDNPAVSDDTLSKLSNYENLTLLELRNTKISQVGIDLLKQPTNLRYIDLTGTKVAPTVIDSLQAALPNCLVVNSFNLSSKEPDRRVAHWLLGVGGSVRIVRSEGSGTSNEDTRVVTGDGEVFKEPSSTVKMD